MDIAAVTAGSLLLNAALNYYTAEDKVLGRERVRFNMWQYSRDVVIMFCRFSIMLRGGLWLPLLWPLTIFETASIQWIVDKYEGREFCGITKKQITNTLKVSIVECVAAQIGRHVVGWDDPSYPTGWDLLKSVYMCPVFDVGLDLGFYVFHRTCHKNLFLYKLVHKDHHVDTAKDFGRLVAFETYTITLLEAISIVASYFLGLAAVCLLKGGPVSLWETAFLICWGHGVELLGHTELSWTPKNHPMRIVHELLGLELQGIEHTMHHKKPLSNFSKRLNFWDRVCGTYEPPDKIMYVRGSKSQLVPGTH